MSVDLGSACVMWPTHLPASSRTGRDDGSAGGICSVLGQCGTPSGVTPSSGRQEWNQEGDAEGRGEVDPGLSGSKAMEASEPWPWEGEEETSRKGVGSRATTLSDLVH